MYLDAACMDMEEALRTLQLIGTKVGQHDAHMHITGVGRSGPIQGESVRQHDDGKPYHPIIGYYLSAGAPTDSASGSATGRRRYSAMRVVRSSDSSTSPFLQTFANNELLTVVIKSYRAGGDDSKDTQPMFHFELKEARVKTFTLMFGGELPNTGAVEIIEFAFRRINIDAAPQTKVGQRGVPRPFDDDLTVEV